MSQPFGRPLNALRVVLRTENPGLAAAIHEILEPLGIAPTWLDAADPEVEGRADVLLWDPALGDAREATYELVTLSLPPKPRALHEEIRTAWRICCLREELAHGRARMQDLQREKEAADLLVDRSEKVLLASYRDLQQTNAELTRKNTELTRALDRASAAQALAEDRKKVLMQVVHDLRSDLFNIAVATDLAQKRLGSQRPFETINRSIDRIEEFLSEKTQIIQRSRPAGCCLMKAALQETLATVSPQLAKKQQGLALQAAEGDAILPLSAIEIEQVLGNLIGNACKFSPEGSTIRFETCLTDTDLHLIVADEGPGIPEPLMGDLGSGRRADPAMPGSGLGLQNVRALLDEVGGHLAWRNGDSGAVFEARIPHIALLHAPATRS